MSRRKGRRKKLDELAEIDERLINAIKPTYSYPQAPFPEIQETEHRLAEEFPADFPDIVKLWADIYTLHGSLIERRAALDDQSPARAAIDLLGSKAFGDARAAQLLLERGYQMASFGPMRAAQEAAELMQFFLVKPNEVEAWIAEDPKFENPGWIRQQIPINAQASREFANLGIHPNWRLIPRMIRREVSPFETNYEIVPGPVREKSVTKALSLLVLFHTVTVIGTIHEHSPKVVSTIWRDLFLSCTNRLGKAVVETGGEHAELLEIQKALAELSLMNKEGDGQSASTS